MKNEEHIEMTEEIVSSVFSWILDNTTNDSSTAKGKTPNDLGYKATDFSKIEIGFDEKLGIDIFTIMFQKKDDGKGKRFKNEKLDDSLYVLIFSFYLYLRKNRKSVHNINDIIHYKPSKYIEAEVETQNRLSKMIEGVKYE